jgi:hypothetical protein
MLRKVLVTFFCLVMGIKCHVLFTAVIFQAKLTLVYICCSEWRSLESWGSCRSCALRQRFCSTRKPVGLFVGPCVTFIFHSVVFLFSLCYKNGGQEFWGALSGLFSIQCGCRMFQSRCRTSVLLCSNALHWKSRVGYWATEVSKLWQSNSCS